MSNTYLFSVENLQILAPNFLKPGHYCKQCLMIPSMTSLSVVIFSRWRLRRQFIQSTGVSCLLNVLATSLLTFDRTYI